MILFLFIFGQDLMILYLYYIQME